MATKPAAKKPTNAKTPATSKSAAKPAAASKAAAQPKAAAGKGSGTKEDPWQLTTPSGTSEYTMYEDETLDPPAIVCVVGTTTLRYDVRAIEDLHAMLKKQGDWMPLGSADEQKPAAEGTVEAWGRSPKTPSAVGMV